MEWGGTLATSERAWTSLKPLEKFTCEKPSDKYVYKVSQEKLSYRQAEWACHAWEGTLWDS